MREILNLALVCLGLGLAVGLPTPASDVMTRDKVERYFQTYGYLGKNMPNPEIAELFNTNKSMAFEYAVKIFQMRYGLEVTGELNDETMNLISMPRCGMADIVTMADTGMDMRKKRYLLTDGWEKTDLSYKITQYPRDDLSPQEVDREIARAFRVWSDVTPLTFRRIEYHFSEVPDIEIRFVSYYHREDSYPFDGPRGILAHAFFPQSPILRGDAHFDDSEQWTINLHTGFNLFQVAAHEFGHALGLHHSQDPSALMAPFYMGYVPDFQLPTDDTMGIQALYGPPSPHGPDDTPSPPTSALPPTMMPGDHDICQDPSFDAITTVVKNGQKKTYGFRGDYFFLLLEDGGIANGYPKLIQRDWVGLPTNIDAAVFWDHRWVWYSTEKKWVRGYPTTFIFKGNQYWIVADMVVLDGPRPVSERDFPEDIDAAMVWKADGKTYFFKGDQYYKYSEWSGVEIGYPRSLQSVWNGLPESLDAAMQTSSGEQVFFKGNQHYFYDIDFNVTPGYPKQNTGRWFMCDSERHGGEHNEQEDNNPLVDVRNVGRN